MNIRWVLQISYIVFLLSFFNSVGQILFGIYRDRYLGKLIVCIGSKGFLARSDIFLVKEYFLNLVHWQVSFRSDSSYRIAVLTDNSIYRSLTRTINQGHAIDVRNVVWVYIAFLRVRGRTIIVLMVDKESLLFFTIAIGYFGSC